MMITMTLGMSSERKTKQQRHKTSTKCSADDKAAITAMASRTSGQRVTERSHKATRAYLRARRWALSLSPTSGADHDATYVQQTVRGFADWFVLLSSL